MDLTTFASVAAIIAVSWVVASFIVTLMRKVRDETTAEKKFNELVDGATVLVGTAMFGRVGYTLLYGSERGAWELWLGSAFAGIIIITVLGRVGFALFRCYKDIPSIIKKFVFGSGTKARSDSEEKNSDAR